MADRDHKNLWLVEMLMIISDTTWRMELKLVMNDHCKLLTKCCYFLDRLKIQDGHQRGRQFSIATLWEICNTNFFSRTTVWIGTILGRSVPDNVLINCCYFLFRSVIQYGCQGHNSLWLAEISKILFSDTTWRMELKIVMNDHCKLLTKCCCFLYQLNVQDGHQRGT
jgi:hypothetical protein